jgi:putative tryptophan/tyrosine transport system substrate-binding protein
MALSDVSLQSEPISVANDPRATFAERKQARFDLPEVAFGATVSIKSPGADMQRRKFIGLVGGAAAAWPLAARAQPQPAERMRRIAILTDLPENESSRQRVAAFVAGLEDQGWREGRNVRLDIRWGANSPENSRKPAAELLALEPDVILTSASAAAATMQQLTSTIPIVFVLVVDPVGAGYVDSLARPGRNLTGFTLFEYSLAGKWLALLKEIAPKITRVAVLRDASVAAGAGQFGVIQAAAQSLGVELRPLSLRDADEIDRGISAFALGPNDGLLVTASPLAGVHRERIIALAARHRLPAVFAYRHFVAAGGLVAYGPDLLSPMPRAASYVSRILKGEKAADLPVQAPIKYELVVNLRTAQALGLAVPPTLLARADEVIE